MHCIHARVGDYTVEQSWDQITVKFYNRDYFREFVELLMTRYTALRVWNDPRRLPVLFVCMTVCRVFLGHVERGSSSACRQRHKLLRSPSATVAQSWVEVADSQRRRRVVVGHGRLSDHLQEHQRHWFVQTSSICFHCQPFLLSGYIHTCLIYALNTTVYWVYTRNFY